MDGNWVAVVSIVMIINIDIVDVVSKPIVNVIMGYSVSDVIIIVVSSIYVVTSII